MIKTNYFDGGGNSYSAADLIAPMASLLSNGIYNKSGGALNILAHSPANLSVDVSSGSANVNGYYVKSDSVVNVPITSNTSGYNRIDSIVVNVDTTNKISTIIAVQGIPSSSPVAPSLSSNQHLLANVLVGNNVSVLNQNVITDMRINVDILGGKANSTQEAWTQPSLLNGWTNLGSSNSVVAYMKDSLGFVHLKGHVKSGTIGAVVFTLPVGYRPSETLDIPAICSSGSAYIDINNAGNVSIPSGSATWTALDGITFKAEQ